MNEPIIKFEKVSFGYEAEDGSVLTDAVKNVSLEIERGSFVAVLGHNGSGKSTLAKLTNAILVPQKGKVTVKSMDTADEKLTNEIRKTVGMVFQNPDNQIVATIVEDDVAFGPENLGVEPSEIRRRVDGALEAVGMTKYASFAPDKLSGGQKQRVAIAGVIAMQTECIVLDEPTAMLDPSGRSEVLNTVLRLNREMGITVLLITHFMDEAVKADRVIVIDNGSVVLDGTPKAVFSQEKTLARAGLSIPQATQLVRRLIADGVDLPPDILDDSECINAIFNLIGEH